MDAAQTNPKETSFNLRRIALLKRLTAIQETMNRVLPNAPTPIPGTLTPVRRTSPSSVTETTVETQLSPGTILGKYRLGKLLGKGASSSVYQAEHVRMPLQAAIKVLHLGNSIDRESILDQLRTEAVLLARVNHPNIVRLWDFDDETAHPHLVMEYVEGRTLAQAMVDMGNMILPDWATFLMMQTVEGLAEAHRHGIIHRDIKPANLLLTKQGNIKIVDYGLGKLRGSTLDANALGSQPFIKGSAAYLAPEQARNPEGIDHRADMYSLGATFYHVMCGRLPFDGKSIMEVVLKHQRDTAIPPIDLVPTMPPQTSALLMRLLAKDPNDRYRDFAELRRALVAILA